jgi:hypothetical protein
MDSWRSALVSQPQCSGRAWFFSRLDSWLEQPHGRIYVVEAEPGYGKTCMAREIVRRLPDAVCLEVKSGQALALPGEWPDLLVVDGLDRHPELVSGLTLRGLEEYTGKLLIFSRPVLALASFRHDDVLWDRLDPLHVDNLSDLANHLAGRPGADAVLRSCSGNFGLAKILSSTTSEIEVFRHLWHMVQEVLEPVEQPLRDLSLQVLTLLAESGSGLEVWRLCDFLGSSAFKVRQALIPLEPLLIRDGDHFNTFHPWLARTLSWAHFRDLEVIHAAIITYFRETYNSWEEMSDPYGWDHLVHHCDRFARTSRKRDFSVLHWLGEGPFLRQKLRQGGKLPGVLRDLERCLIAAMEETDLPRLAFYAFQLPRVRQERMASEMHRLADHGNIECALEYAQLIPRENHKLLALLLLTWQASDERRLNLADQLLTQARQVDSGGMFPEMNLLLVSLCAALLKSMPHREKEILELLSRDEHTGRAASNYLTLGLIEGLEDRLRTWVLQRGWSQAPRASGRDQQRLSVFISQSLRALQQNDLASIWSGALTQPQLKQAEFDERLKNIVGVENETDRLDQLVDLADQVCRLHPKEWLSHGVAVLSGALQNFQEPDSWLRGFAQLCRLWMTLGAIPEAFEGLERLTQLAKDMELDNQLRVRIIADLALGFYRLGDSSRSQQLISKAAAGAVQEQSPEQRIAALAFVAAATAQLGNPARARDLAFTLLEAIEPPPGPIADHFCRMTFRLASSASGSPDQLRQALGKDEKELMGLGSSPRERASLLLGLARAAFQGGDGDWATQLLMQAASQAHQLVSAKLKAWTLADLACLAWDMGQHDRYRAFLQEADEALESESVLIHRLEGMVDLCRALAHSKDREARVRHRQVLGQLAERPPLEICLSPALPRILPLLQEPETRQQAEQIMQGLRGAADQLPDADKDLFYSGLLHLELAFGEYDRALAALTPVQNPQVRSQAMVDLAVGLTARDPREGLGWLPLITRQPDRLRAIRLILAELGAEKRPWRQASCHQALQQVTLLAQEDESTMDLVVSYWLTRETDLRKFELTGKRMGWAQDGIQPLVVKPA